MCFLVRKVSAGYWLLMLVTTIRLIIMVQDYRLRANQHYMLNWIVLAYLFSGQARPPAPSPRLAVFLGRHPEA